MEAIFALEALTNPRILDQIGDISLVPVSDRIVNVKHGSYAMAPFTHLNPEGGRFSTFNFGAYYCARDIDTAIKETVYHRERVLGYTNEPAQSIDMRTLVSRFDAKLVDVTGADFANDPIYHATDYSHSQAFASRLKSDDEDGVVYLSVRHPSHICYALFRPRLVTDICQGDHFEYFWNGQAINNVSRKCLA
ncbi:MAG: RES domain-containing protein [Oleiphilus sp.]|nr:MAG: RES domain-containing protein [Oleiphilus sp.]